MSAETTPADAGTIHLVPEAQLRAFVIDVFVANGLTRADAAIVAECLLMANLQGTDSHGVVRLAHYTRRLQNRTIKARPKIVFERTAPSVGILDGGDGLGHVVGYNACTYAMEMARETGMGSVAIKDSSHFGMAGFYVHRLVSEGFIGMSMTDTDPFLIPFGSRKAFFGTNPICFGFPTNDYPVVLDMATTVVPYGKLALAQIEGRSVPEEWGFDAEGNPTSDPHAVAGLHPIAGPKGSGLAMIIDIFCSVLSGVPWGPHINKMYVEMDGRRQLGHFIMAMDVSRFMPLEMFKSRLGQLTKEMNELPPVEGFEKVLYPGQIEGMRREQRRAEGIPIDPGLYSELTELGEQFGVKFPEL